MSVNLYKDKQDCCGCGACKSVCPRNAISMVADEDGFLYPQIDIRLCVECGACQNVCGYQSLPNRSKPIACYAASAKDAELLRNSASGGVFAVMAKKTLNRGGVVYGVAMNMEDTGLTARHIRIGTVSEMAALQGSKYVQSTIGATYKQAKKDLQEGKQVLFSGTPCQIAGLRSFLGKEYDTLFTVEVICHGVPNSKMFQDFLETLERKKGNTITAFSFRSKDKGQGMNTSIEYHNTNGGYSRVSRNGHRYSYMHYFLKAYIYRINCYSCPFATEERVADITIGDYWGFHEEHPIISRDVKLNNTKGVSCVLLNSERGIRLFEECSSDQVILATEFEKIAKHNEQLRKPCKKSQERDVILKLYREKGYDAVEQHFQKTCKKERMISAAMDMVPKGLKRAVKRAIGILK